MTPKPGSDRAAVAATAGAFAAFGACLAVAAAFAEPPSNPQPSAPNTAAPFAPLTWFNNHCANCHGAYGALYAPVFGRGITDAQLVAKVDEMVTGPADTQLEAEPLKALVAYHRAIIRKEAFVAVTTQDRDFLHGEMTPGATLAVLHGDDAPSLKIDGHTWTAALKGPLRQTIVIEAALGDAKPSRIEWPAQRHSHTEPLPDPRQPEPQPAPGPNPEPAHGPEPVARPPR